MGICSEVQLAASANWTERDERRQRTFRAGMVVINNNTSTISCTIRNLSEHGARLRVEGVFQPPADFTLRTPADKWEARARVVWRKDGELGVRFLADRPPLALGGGRSVT